MVLFRTIFPLALRQRSPQRKAVVQMTEQIQQCIFSFTIHHFSNNFIDDYIIQIKIRTVEIH